MRGGPLHRWMVDRLRAEADRRGFWTRSEAYVGRGFADLVIGRDGRLIVIEVERAHARLGRDLSKARSIHATELWIVVPDSTRRRPYRRRFPPETGSETRILVLSYPHAIYELNRIGGLLDHPERHRPEARTRNQE